MKPIHFLLLNVAVVLLLSGLTARGQEPEGLLIYEEPGTTYPEAIEYRTFDQDNALFSTVVTSAGARERLKSGGVRALLPYPPGTAGAEPGMAESALHQITDLEASYPRVKPELELARGKWARAAAVFQQERAAALAARTPGLRIIPTIDRSAPTPIPLPPGGSLTGATDTTAEIMATDGLITSVALDKLSPEQVLNLNATSRHVQLPLGIEKPTPTPTAGRDISKSLTESDLTRRIEMTGHRAIGFCAQTLAVSASTFTVWAFFVVLPGLVLVLLLTVIWMSARPPITKLPRARGPNR